MRKQFRIFWRADLFAAYPLEQTGQIDPYRNLLEFEYGIRCELERNAKGRTLHLTKIKNDDSDDTPTPGTDTVTTVME